MKKIIKKSALFLATFIICFIMMPLNVDAGTIAKATATVSGNTITVNGTAGDGVSAVMIYVYGATDQTHPVVAQSAEVNMANKSFSLRLNDSYPDDTYVIKVADYNGGAFFTINNVKVSTPKPKTTTTTPAKTTTTTSTSKTTTSKSTSSSSSSKKDSAPKTGDPFHGTPVPAFVVVAMFSCAGAVFFSRDRKRR